MNSYVILDEDSDSDVKMNFWPFLTPAMTVFMVKEWMILISLQYMACDTSFKINFNIEYNGNFKNSLFLSLTTRMTTVMTVFTVKNWPIIFSLKYMACDTSFKSNFNREYVQNFENGLLLSLTISMTAVMTVFTVKNWPIKISHKYMAWDTSIKSNFNIEYKHNVENCLLLSLTIIMTAFMTVLRSKNDSFYFYLIIWHATPLLKAILT